VLCKLSGEFRAVMRDDVEAPPVLGLSGSQTHDCCNVLGELNNVYVVRNQSVFAWPVALKKHLLDG